MIGIEVQQAMTEFGNALRAMDRQLDAVTKLWIVKAAFMIESDAKKIVSDTSNKNVKIPGLRRSGQLMNSISSTFKYGNGTTSAEIGPRGVIYARMREYGGVIRPKRAKKLFIPISLRGQKEGPSRGGKSNLKYGVDFVLAKRAVIPERPYMRLAYYNQTDKALDLLLEMIATNLLRG